MKKLFALIVTIAATVAIALADDVRMYTVPRGPSREALERLSLTQAWKTRIPLEGRRDGIFSLQILADKVAPQIAVQTLSGTVLLFDGETGDLLWRTTIAQPYWTAQPVGYNSTSIFAIRRNQLHVLNRENGRERVYSLDKDSKLPIFGMRLLLVPSAAPVADEDTVIISFGPQVTAYRIPIFEEDERPRESDAKGDVPLARPSLQPEFAWNYVTTPIQVQQSPLIAGGQVGVIGNDGTFLSLNRFQGLFQYSYKLHGVVSAPMGQHNYSFYIGAEDNTVYALDIRNSRLLWRLFANGPVLRQPEVTDRDVFVVAERTGLYRVDRQMGAEVWLNRAVDRFLGTNQRFVYALDRQGSLLILDYERGTTLASYDMRDWTVPVANELTDRIYLGSHDGQLLCLHHRDQRKPLTLKTFPVPVKVEEKAKDEKKEMKEPEKEAEKEKEPEKEKAKDAEKGKEKEKAERGARSAERGAWSAELDILRNQRPALHARRLAIRTLRSARYAPRVS